MAARLVRLSAVVAVLLATAGPAHASLSAPAPTSPANGAVVESLPAFAWAKVADADHYEFQFAADSGFNSAVLGQGNDDFFTNNTRATLKKVVPNGTYWWRVRSVDPNGGVSPWSPGRSLKKAWTAGASLLVPSSGAGLNFPGDALAMGWSAVPGAAHYLVSVATDRCSARSSSTTSTTRTARPRCRRTRSRSAARSRRAPTTGASRRSTRKVTAARPRRSPPSTGSGPPLRRCTSST